MKQVQAVLSRKWENPSRIHTCFRPSIRSKHALSTAEGEINDGWVTDFTSALKQDNKREREFITTDLSCFDLCINMQQQKFSEKNLPINQSINAASAKIQPWKS